MAVLVCLLACLVSGGAGMFGLSLYHRAAGARNPTRGRRAAASDESAPQ